MTERKAKPAAQIKKTVGQSAAVEVTPPKSAAGDWRLETLARMRGLIFEAIPEIVEEQKWKKPSNGMVGVPVWSHHGIICTGETYKQVVKLTFAKGASVPDPSKLFNSSLEGNARRAIDIREGEMVDADAFKALIKAAADLNAPVEKKPKTGTKKTKPAKLLTGGNPQIAKADGDEPVQAYLDAIPGWKQEIGKRLDALIVKAVPKVQKAVKWNSPFYGIEGQGWFMSFHMFTNYVKVTFFQGTSLDSPPTGGKTKDARWIDIHEDDLNEKQMTAWIKQAAKLPGWLA